MDKLEKIKNDDEILSQAEMYHWEEWEKNTYYDDGLKDGIKQGITESITNTIKNMLNNNYKIEEIMNITNKSKEEILEIKNNM